MTYDDVTFEDGFQMNEREADGLTVELFVDGRYKRTFIRLTDRRDGTAETFQVPAIEAAEAFVHPFAYQRRGYRNKQAA